jgi:hypothetical protein
MNKRLKIIAIILCVVYVGGIVMHIYGMAPDMKHAFNEGYNSEREGIKSTARTFYLSVKPETGGRTFPTVLHNQSDGIPMKAEFEKIVVELSNVEKDKLPEGRRVVNIGLWLLGLFLIIATLMIPFNTFFLIESITTKTVFDPKNILRLRRIGYALLIFYATNIVFNYLYYRAKVQIIQLEGYSLQMDWGNTSLVIFGIAVLLFSEVLKISVQLKEDQELTV